MGTYYVCADTGTDAVTSGSSVDDPWLTIDYADSQLSGGSAHTVWVAPGVYGETVTLSAGGGGVGSEIEWRGDPMMTKDWRSGTGGSAVQPGPVRVSNDSAGDGTGTPQAGTVLNLGSNDHVHFYDMVFEGVEGASSIVVVGNTAATNQRLFRCTIMGSYYGLRYVDIDYCVVMAGHTAIDGGDTEANRCMFVAGSRIASGSGVLLKHCLVFVGGYGCYQAVLKNCILIGGSYGFYVPGADSDNNIILGSTIGARIVSGTKPEGCFIAFCDSAEYSAEDLSGNRSIYCSGEDGTTPPENGHCFVLPPPVEMLMNVAKAFSIKGFNDYDQADGSGAASETDVLGKAATMRSSGESTSRVYQGAIRITDSAERYDSTNGNVMRIQKLGDEVLHLPLKAGTAITISVKVACANMSGTPVYPQIVLEPVNAGDFTAPGADTATGTSEETLTQSLTTGTAPAKDCMARLILRSRDTAASHYSDFYGITVT